MNSETLYTTNNYLRERGFDVIVLPNEFPRLDESDINIDEGGLLKSKEDNKQILRLIYKHYLNIRFSGNSWNESYKWRYLPLASRKIQDINFTGEDIEKFVEILDNSNPPQGTFSRWPNFRALNKLTDKSPEKLAQIFSDFYDDEENLAIRIENFRKSIKSLQDELIDEEKYKGDFSGNFIGHALAAYDYTEYPLYRMDFLRNFSELFSIEVGSSIAERYDNLFQIAHEISSDLDKYTENLKRSLRFGFKKFEKENDLSIVFPSALDGQDVMYTFGIEAGFEVPLKSASEILQCNLQHERIKLSKEQKQHLLNHVSTQIISNLEFDDDRVDYITNFDLNESQNRFEVILRIDEKPFYTFQIRPDKFSTDSTIRSK